MSEEISKENVTGIVLCGGRGSRLNGQDKPLLQLDDLRIIDHIVERMSGQASAVIVSCSRNVAIYEALHTSIAIDRELNQGPLAGLCEAFDQVTTEWALTTPGDTPFLSHSLLDLLRSQAEKQGIAVPLVNGVRQNLNLLLNRERRQQLGEFHKAGGQAVKHWLDQAHIESIDLTAFAEGFFNINTQSDLDSARSKLATSSA